MVEVLYEDNHCLVLNKPAGVLTMGDQTGDVTLLNQAKAYVQQKYQKPGAVFLGVVHRLDRPVSGVLLYARTSKAASRLSEQFREHRVEKVYWAAVTGRVTQAAGELVQELVKDPATNTVRVVPIPTSQSQSCRLAFRRLSQHGSGPHGPGQHGPGQHGPGQHGPVSVLEIRPQTGRSHQIRVQLASQGWSIVGDRKYGSQTQFAAGQIALHARALTFEHPTQRTPVTVECPPPADWRVWR